MPKLLRTIRTSGKVGSVAFNPKGDFIGAACEDGAKIWETKTGSLYQSLPLLNENTGLFRRFFAKTRAFSVSFSPDGDKLATGNYDHNVAVWNLRDKMAPMIFKGHRDCVTKVQFVAADCLFSYGNRDKSVRIWDTSTGICRKNFPVTGWGAGMAVSSDGKTIAVGDCIENIFTLYDAADGRPIRTLSKSQRMGGLKGSCGVAFSPNGSIVITGMWDGTMKLWETETGTCLQTLAGHKSGLCHLAFSPDGRHILTASLDGTVRLWNCDSSSEVHRFNGQDFACAVCFSPCGNLGAISNLKGYIQVWDLGSPKNVRPGINAKKR